MYLLPSPACEVKHDFISTLPNHPLSIHISPNKNMEHGPDLLRAIDSDSIFPKCSHSSSAVELKLSTLKRRRYDCGAYIW